MGLPIRILFALWPGALAAWRYGDVRSLLVAVLFGGLLSIAWLGTTIWPMWLSSWRLIFLWWVVGVGGLLSLLHNTARGGLRAKRPGAGCPDASLQQAQAFYLQANYYEAEQVIVGYCHPRAMDAEAALLMAGILRRTGRFSQAVGLLDELSLLDCGLPWLEEIERERELSVRQKVRSQADSL